MCEVAESVALPSAPPAAAGLHAVPGRNSGQMMNSFGITWRSIAPARGREPLNCRGAAQVRNGGRSAGGRRAAGSRGREMAKPFGSIAQFICPWLLASGFLGHAISKFMLAFGGELAYRAKSALVLAAA